MARRIKVPPRVDPFIDVWKQLNRQLCALIISGSPEIRHAATDWQNLIGDTLLAHNKDEAKNRSKIIELIPDHDAHVLKPYKKVKQSQNAPLD